MGPRHYVRRTSGGYGVYTTVVTLHGLYKTYEEAMGAAIDAMQSQRADEEDRA